MDLPHHLPNLARNRIIKAEIIARRAMEEIDPFEIKPEEWDAAVIKYIMAVVYAYAHEECLLGQRPTGRSADKIRDDVERLLVGTITEAESRYDSPAFSPMLLMGNIHPEARRKIEATDGWRKYEDELIAMVEPEGDDKKSKRHPYATEVKAWMKRKGIESQPLAAKALGVSIDSLKSIMSGKGKARFGKDALARVLKEITSKAG